MTRRRVLVEWLEERTLLSGGYVAFPTFAIFNPHGSTTPAAGSSTPTGLAPVQVRTAYGIDSISVAGIVGDGNGQTIAIVDAYDWPTAYADLQAFDAHSGIPDPPSFIELNQNGQPSPLPPVDPSGPGSATSWSIEESLDVERFHAMRPGRTSSRRGERREREPLLGRASGRRPPRRVGRLDELRGDEFSGETAFDPNFTTPSGHAPVTFLASTGDFGKPGKGYPRTRRTWSPSAARR